MTRSSEDIRREFIAFFEKRGHTFVPSSSLLPADDPTLLFANAGMNQFKDIFLGLEQRGYCRAVNSQKCIRAGGKHNDLEDVGHDCYHHTLFEMLGNWSFGDYFKAEAVAWAWELLTEVWGLPKERLHVTVFAGDPAAGLPADDEAAELWAKTTDIDPSHIGRFGQEDNFWAPGDTGPCGPCSEIHYDGTDDLSGGKLVNAGDPGVIELWNLVFMQYSRDAAGELTPLPAQHVDTGMGFERVCRIMQGKVSNYASDLFVPIIEQIETLTSHRYGSSSGLADRFDATGHDMADVACRVVADHARCLTFAIADGVIPSNEGRGYVLRRILRRAARYGRQYLNIDGPFLTKLVPTIVKLMGDAFPELRARQKPVADTIAEEEASFGKTLDRGIDLFQRQAEKLQAAGRKTLDGEVAFDLYATYGFPMDLTQIMAEELGMTVDLAGYEAAMAQHRELSGASGEKFKVTAIANLPATDDSPKYDRKPITARVLGWVADDKFVDSGELAAGDEAAVVLDRTCFYGEQGGQVGDTGSLAWDGGRFAVCNSSLAGQCVLHVGAVEQGKLAVGQQVAVEVAAARLDTMRNHTATHLLNWALRRVLGDHINQAGSEVGPERLRFDFTHDRAVTADQLAEAERLVNRRVLADEPVVSKVVPLADARKIPGVRAVFGEKYPDPVRVMVIGTDDPLADADADVSAEFCGGTHLDRTSQVGMFKIFSEESVAKGVRRITALTGPAAVAHIQDIDAAVRALSGRLRAAISELPARVEAMQRELKDLRKRPAKGAGAAGLEIDHKLASPCGAVLVGRCGEADPQAMRSLCDQQRQKGAAAVFVGSASDEKVTLIAMVSEELAAGGACSAVEWVKAVAPIVGGGGGGKPTLAQAGGKDAAKLPEALAAAAEWIKGRLT